MRYGLILVLMVFGTVAAAHPGHLAEVAGHDHWLAAGALAAAAAIALAVLVAKARARGSDTEAEDAESEADDASQEA